MGQIQELVKAQKQADTEKELRQIAYKERAELEQQVERLRPYLTALQNMSERYPNGVYILEIDSGIERSAIVWLCEQIADEAAQIQEADAQHAAADRVFEQ